MSVHHARYVGRRLGAVLLGMLLLANIPLAQQTRAASARFFVRQGDNLGKAPDGSDWIQTIQEAIDMAPNNPAEPPVIEVWADGNLCSQDPLTGACRFSGALTIAKPLKLILKPGTGMAQIEPNAGVEFRRAITIDGRNASITATNTEISGFVIYGGDATYDSTIPGYESCGGGILSVQASPLIRGNIIRDNYASAIGETDAFGGVIYISGGAPIVRGNLIEHNFAADYTARRGHGGGIAAYNSSARIEGNRIQSNYAATLSQGIGGGVYLNTSSGGAFVLDGNLIRANFASTGSARPSAGGGVFAYAASIAFANNMVTQNTDQENGDGILLDFSSGTLANTTIAGNGGATGVGLHARLATGGATPQLTLVNTIIARHDIGVIASSGASVQLRTTIFDGQTSDAQQQGGAITNLSARSVDPLFVSQAAGDYHIRRGSPAINASEQVQLERDVDGQPRIGVPDIGADEFIVPANLPLVVRR